MRGASVALLASLVVSAGCGERAEPAGDARSSVSVSPPPSPASDPSPEPTVDPREAARRAALLRLQDRALERQSLAAHELVALSVGLCGMDHGMLPPSFAQAIQTVSFVPFVGRLGAPHSDPPRSGHWYDAEARVVFADADLVASMAGLDATERTSASALGLGLVFADAAPAALGASERFAAAGAFVRTFIAGPNAPAVLDAERATRALDRLDECLESLGEPSSAGESSAPRPMALPTAADARAAAVEAFRRGYADPTLGFVPSLASR